DREIAFLFRRQETEPAKERNDVFAERIEVVDLIHPHVIRLVPNLSTLEMPLQQSQNDFVLLRHVQAQGNFPRQLVILPPTERQMETSFAVNEPSEVISDGIRN